MRSESVSSAWIAKQKPDEFQYASAGVYSTTHFMWEKILRATGIRVRHMPTTGA